MDINLDDFTRKGPPLHEQKEKKGKMVRREFINEPFLKGPIPLNWLIRVINLGVSRGVTGVILSYISGRRNQETFKLGINDIAELSGIKERTIQRSLRQLEKEHLIFVVREPGKKMAITINKNLPNGRGADV